MLLVFWYLVLCSGCVQGIKVVRTEEGVMPDKDWRVELANPLQHLQTFTLCARFYSHQFRKSSKLKILPY